MTVAEPPAPPVDRRYRMIRLAAGDWLCPSNDLATLWRFHTFVDGSAHGLEVDYVERTFWRATYMPLPDVSKIDIDALPEKWDGAWREADWYLPTRNACITLMLKVEAEKARAAAAPS